MGADAFSSGCYEFFPIVLLVDRMCRGLRYFGLQDEAIRRILRRERALDSLLRRT
jgi:hypothetical protein